MYDAEIRECTRRIALGASLNILENSNPDWHVLIQQGLLQEAVLHHADSINRDESGTVTFLKGVQTFKAYLERVRLEAEQAHIDLRNYQQLPQDGA